jgi:predicted O-methyltransferase YrrM
VLDTKSLRAKQDKISRRDQTILGIDFNDANHVRILTEVFPRYIASYRYADDLPETGQLTEYFTNNSQFGWLDSRTLPVLLQHLRPQRIVEIGSGFSSLLTADVNKRLLQNSAEFSCIEPYPREFLRKPIPGLHELLIEKVEDLPISYFAELAPGDVLFIDSSHVAKTGSDVNYLAFEILPRLQPGVIVHIHDVFLPNEYPKDWVLDDNRSWNEQYLVRALLM